MDQRTERHAAAMAKAGVGLLALPLAELPPITHVGVLNDRGGVLVELQLAHPVEAAGALCAWADVLPDAIASARVHETYTRLEVAGVVDGVPVVVWGHLRDDHRIDAGPVVDLDGTLTVAALRRLAERWAVTVNA
ncbi:hypothetical protein [Pseudonocardia sp. WMMC193]|uniref:hypothetical protein n=1 Tax=Pseudonocardia sp. WMMC193 TaxID=2911965 RepID=UPI001F2866C5|nr:hypothetical protein [Pseudonocardia sp. WMMC193]MCF7552254.1 hypothetical protein [Pseudonocardia sp. WMMC193]